MATAAGETSPLLPQHHVSPSAAAGTSTTSRNRAARTVTFNPLTQIATHSSPSTPGSSVRPSNSASLALASPTSTTGRLATSKEPILSAFNSKLRRRNSHGAPLPTRQPSSGNAPRLGPQRTSRTAEKLKLLPNPDYADEGPDEESGRDVYAQFTRIKDPTARRDAARLGKADRERLPRVTAYCVANGYRLEGIMRFMKSRTRTRGANPKLFDECLYSPYNYDHVKRLKDDEERLLHRQDERQAMRRDDRVNNTRSLEDQIARLTTSPRLAGQRQGRRFSDSAVEVDDHMKQRREDLMDLQEELQEEHLPESAIEEGDGDEMGRREGGSALQHVASRSSTDLVGHREADELHDRRHSELSTDVHTPEVFIFDYGTLVIWGMTEEEEQKFMRDLSKFSEAPLPPESVQTEEFNFYYTKEYQARIYNDFISLRDPKHNMTKLAISHALAQSVKTSLFEDLVSDTIETTSPLPALIAQTGSVNLTTRQLNMQIGELFILRINIHLQGSVLDSPELMWAEPQLEPVYAAVRSYLEIGQRVELLNERLDVIADLLAVLREQGSRRHGEMLEWIVIVLVAAEIVVAAANILVDLWAGVD